MQDSLHHRNLLTCVYFAFTSLSTVGFGDYYPRGNLERIMCGVLIFGGVIVFGVVNG